MTVTCWFCDKPVQRIGWGFAVCGDGRHAEQARLLGMGIPTERPGIPYPMAETTDDEFLDNS